MNSYHVLLQDATRRNISLCIIFFILLIPVAVIGVEGELDDANDDTPHSIDREVALLGAVVGPGWHTYTVDNTGSVGKWTSLALDASGYPHISYYDESNSALKYAWMDAGGWHTYTVDTTGSVGKWTSLALDASGYPHISYYDESQNALKYAWKDAGGWHTYTIHASAGYEDVGEHTSIALSSAGYPWISYLYYASPDSRLQYAWLDSGGWTNNSVDSGGYIGDFNSIALDSADYPHFSYHDDTNGDLKYAWLDSGGSGWHYDIVDQSSSNVGYYTSLELDGSGHPHISYQNFGPLYHAWKDAGGWHTEYVDYRGAWTSLELDGSGHPHISYCYDDLSDGVNPILKYARYDGSLWHTTTVESGNVGEYTSLALDSTGNPHISYYDSSGALKYARYLPAQFIGVFRPSTHTFYLDYNGNGIWDGIWTDRAYNFGLTGDEPVSGDWNALGRTCIGVFRPSTHMFYLDYNGNGVWNGASTDRAYTFGLTGDIPVSGDWNTIGRTCIGVFRPSTHMFYLDWNGNGVWDGASTDRAYNFGLTGDIPISGDWNIIGKTCIGVFRPSTHTFYLDWNGNGRWDGAVTDRAYNFGLTDDKPFSGDDWGELGATDFGVFRSPTHTFYLDYNGNGRWDGAVVDRSYNFGLNGDTPVAGVWE